ncbi:MAG: ABC transporter permease [Leptospirales bacterium]|nr:ABC transporter permease [Leptospirales bacterium]
MKALHKKVVRDLWQIRFQVATISLVAGVGIGVLIASDGAYAALRGSRERFYQHNRFANVFASVKSAPVSLLPRIRSIPGVLQAEERLIYDAILDLPETTMAQARLVSLPERGTNLLNEPLVLEGSLPQPTQRDCALIHEAFGRANELHPGDRITLILNGKRKIVTVCGIGISPEFVYAFSGSNPMPDHKHFGVFWMQRSTLEQLLDMNGAFNDVSLSTSPGASENNIRAELDLILAPYGAVAAYGRSKHPSDMFLSDEIKQLRVTAVVVPLLFLGVAAFLLNVVIGRLVQKQRPQIATLKSLGYTNVTIGRHFLFFACAIVLPGQILGLMLGNWLGRAMTDLYADFYRLPGLDFQMHVLRTILAVATGSLAACTGAARAVWSVTRLEPAEAMRPPVPEMSRLTLRNPILGRLPVATRWILRQLINHPLRLVLAVTGSSCAIMIIVLGFYSSDAVNFLIRVQFGMIQREDATIMFRNPVSQSVLFDVQKRVLLAEGYRNALVRLRVGPARREILLSGLPADAQLRRVISRQFVPFDIPPNGILLNRKLGEKLNIKTGDEVELEFLEGKRRRVRTIVSGTVDEFLGTGAYIQINNLHNMIGEPPVLTSIAVRLDPVQEKDLLEYLKESPLVSGVLLKKSMLEAFRVTLGDMLVVYSMILLSFALAMSAGVVYNLAMISLSEKSWDLATLRVLGFRPREVYRIMVSEIIIQTLPAIPLGCAMGYGVILLILDLTQTESISMPAIAAPSSYLIAVLVVLAATTGSILILRNRMKQLDLLEVLKIRE